LRLVGLAQTEVVRCERGQKFGRAFFRGNIAGGFDRFFEFAGAEVEFCECDVRPDIVWCNLYCVFVGFRGELEFAGGCVRVPQIDARIEEARGVSDRSPERFFGVGEFSLAKINRSEQVRRLRRMRGIRKDEALLRLRPVFPAERARLPEPVGR